MSVRERGKEDHHSAAGLVRACGGSFIFAFPLLMTMEMWWLGFQMDRLRLACLVIAAVPLLYRLSFHSGYDENVHWKENMLDTFVAYAVGWLVSVVMLLLFGVLRPGMPADEWLGKIALQTVPASVGAMLARSQINGQEGNSETKGGGGRDWLLAAAGALFLGLTAAPTEEMVLIAFQISPWEGLALVILSLVIAHGFAHATEAKRRRVSPSSVPFGEVFFRSTVFSYVIALTLSAYLLWSFGRLDNLALEPAVLATVVLGFPASLGAAAAVLLL